MDNRAVGRGVKQGKAVDMMARGRQGAAPAEDLTAAGVGGILQDTDSGITGVMESWLRITLPAPHTYWNYCTGLSTCNSFAN